MPFLLSSKRIKNCICVVLVHLSLCTFLWIFMCNHIFRGDFYVVCSISAELLSFGFKIIKIDTQSLVSLSLGKWWVAIHHSLWQAKLALFAGVKDDFYSCFCYFPLLTNNGGGNPSGFDVGVLEGEARDRHLFSKLQRESAFFFFQYLSKICYLKRNL